MKTNWKNPGPLVLKYTRNRSSIPAQMVQQLVKDMLLENHPASSSDEVDLVDSDPSAMDQIQYFTKKPAQGRASYDLRYRCSAAEDGSKIACGRLTEEDCNHEGGFLPDLQLFCKHCSRVRPEIALQIGRK